jgi:hypothetical protein
MSVFEAWQKRLEEPSEAGTPPTYLLERTEFLANMLGKLWQIASEHKGQPCDIHTLRSIGAMLLAHYTNLKATNVLAPRFELQEAPNTYGSDLSVTFLVLDCNTVFNVIHIKYDPILNLSISIRELPDGVYLANAGIDEDSANNGDLDVTLEYAFPPENMG